MFIVVSLMFTLVFPFRPLPDGGVHLTQMSKAHAK